MLYAVLWGSVALIMEIAYRYNTIMDIVEHSW